MIYPILYSPDTTSFNNQGIGALSDTISCTVTEERNGIFELQAVYPIDGIHYSEIRYSSIILAHPDPHRRSQPFVVYRITRPMNGRVTIYAEHISYRMSHIPVRPFTAQSVAGAFNTLPNQAVESCPFTFWTDKDTTGNLNIALPRSMRAVLGGEQGSILDVYGGEYEFNRFEVKLYGSRGADRGVTIRYGKNLTTIEQDEDIANTITGIMPFYRNDEQATVMMLPEYCVYSDYAVNYPYKRVVPVDLTDKFSNPPTEAQLRSAAESYINQQGIGIPNVNLKVSFVALWQTEEYKDFVSTERINLCDTVTIEFEKLGISVKAKVIKTTYDVLLGRYKSLEIGEVRSNMSSTLRKIKQDMEIVITEDFVTRTLLGASIDRATELITGGRGGHVVTVLDDAGEPQELLILGDTADYETAQKVWRWNQNGLGYSSTGYDGTYGTAITNDGHIVADYIDTGTLTANILKAGLLADVAGKNYWNLTTGEFRLNSTSLAIIAGSQEKTIDTYITDSLNQENVFNALTNNGVTQGLYLATDSLGRTKVYINASFIQTGKLRASKTVSGQTVETLYVDTDTGEVRINAKSLKIEDSSIDDIVDTANGAQWGTSPTEAATAAKAVTSSDFRLYKGARIIVYFTHENTANNPTLNVNGTGAKAIRVYGDTLTSTSPYNWLEKTNVQFVYSGTYWHMVDSGALGNLQAFDESLGQKAVFDRLTNNGVTQGIYLENQKIYINAEYIKSGTVSANYVRGGIIRIGGGETYGNGILQAHKADGTRYARMDINGFYYGNVSNDQGLSNPNFKIDQDGNCTAKSFTADDYIRVDGNVMSLVKIPIASWAQANLGQTIYGYVSFGTNAFVVHYNNSSTSSSYHELFLSSDELNADAPHYELLGNEDAEQVLYNNVEYPMIYGRNNSKTRGVMIGRLGFYVCSTSGSERGYGEVSTNSLHAGGIHSTKHYSYTASDKTTVYNPVILESTVTVKGTKSKLSSTKDYGERKLYSYETPSPYSGDIGEGVINEDGLCYVVIDPIFAETISTATYQVFLQKYGEGDCYVSERKSGHFIVKGTPGMAFGWEIKAKQIEFTQFRLEKDYDTIKSEDTIRDIDYGGEALEYISEIKTERESGGKS